MNQKADSIDLTEEAVIAKWFLDQGEIDGPARQAAVLLADCRSERHEFSPIVERIYDSYLLLRDRSQPADKQYLFFYRLLARALQEQGYLPAAEEVPA